MKTKFIFVESLSGLGHVIAIDKILSVSPYSGTGEKNKSSIKAEHDTLHSTQTPSEIYKIIQR